MLLPLLVLAAPCSPVVTDSTFTSTQEQGVERFDGGLRVTATGLSTGPDAGFLWAPGSRFGTLDSVVLDARQTVRWTSVNWRTARPSGVRLPDNGGVEAYRSDSMNMTGNFVLFHFDEAAWTGAPNEVKDTSGRMHHGHVDGGGATTLAEGLFGRAGSFDGGCVLVPDTPTLHVSNGLTMAAWFLPRVLDGNPQGLIAKRVDYLLPSTHNVFLWTGDQLWVDLDTENDRFFSPSVITPGVWHHVAVVYDGMLPAPSRASVYVDGVLDSVAQETSAALPPNPAPLAIGCLPNPSGGILQGLNGLMDEVALWSRPLSATEVAALHRRGTERVLLQVRSCFDPTCGGGGPFVGPLGAADTYFTESGVVTLPDSRYVQFRLWLQNDVELEAVQLYGTALSGACPGDGGADGGAADAGLADGGGDAGEADAGAEDAGAGDGGSFDAGADAGAVADGGTGDGGAVDAGPGVPRDYVVACGCGASGGPALLGAVLLVLLVRRRRCARVRADSAAAGCSSSRAAPRCSTPPWSRRS